MFRIEENTTLDEFKTSFAEIFSRPLPKQFAIFEAARMRDSKKGLLFLLPESLIPSIPCIKIGDSRLAQWIFLNKLADGDSRRKAMEMWVSDHRWGDILAMIEKLCSSARNKRRQETILEVDDEEDEAPENNGDVNTVHSGGSRPNLAAEAEEEAAAEVTRRAAAPTAPLFASCTGRTELKLTTVMATVVLWPATTSLSAATATHGETAADGDKTTKQRSSPV